MTEEELWLRNWFVRRCGASDDHPEPNSAANFFEAGLIDSFGVIELISDIEEHFDIRFTERHFQDRRFPTIEGLGGIIGELTRLPLNQVRSRD